VLERRIFFLQIAEHGGSSRSSSLLRGSKERMLAQSIADKGLIQIKTYTGYYLICSAIGLYGIFGASDFVRSQMSPALLSAGGGPSPSISLIYHVAGVIGLIMATSWASFLFFRTKKCRVIS
jgi:hypothetical protein